MTNFRYVPHDIYYAHYGLASLMCNLYSGLLACGLVAGLASLTLLTATCLGLPACVLPKPGLSPGTS